MTQAFLDIAAPGLMATLQDIGRVGHQAAGMPVAGAMDPVALRLANALVGNPENTGALEIGYLGPTVTVAADSARLAFAGDARLTLQPANGGDPVAVRPWRTLRLKRGDRLAVGAVEDGAVAYLAVEGGFAVQPFLGSQSTYLRSGIGGFHGRALRAGDRLPLCQPAARDDDERELTGRFAYGSGPLRVVLGPQDDRFTDNGIGTFLTAAYTVTKEADRMGLRLDGPLIGHTSGADITSEGLVAGSVQVPGNGKPIILMMDRQTTGGYTKIATVISADLPRVGRLRPGDSIHFAAVPVGGAESARREQEGRIRALIGSIRAAEPDVRLDLDALYNANLISGMVDAASGVGR